MDRIIVGVDASERSDDAIAFGGAWARDSGVGVTVAHAYPWQHLPFAGTHEANRLALEESKATLLRKSEPLRDLPGLETRSLPEPTPARALQELAEASEAGLIVVGSSHIGRLGRVLPGSTAERLLHGSPCPVAVVPHGYRPAERHGPTVIACGWDGSPESEAALGAAEELALKTSASLRVIRAFEPPKHYDFHPALGVARAQSIQAARSEAERALDERMARLPADLEAAGELHEAHAYRLLIEVSGFVDLLVLGSRGYGPLRAVLLGGVSSRVVREAGCPVIVLPSGARRPVASVVGATDEETVA